MNSATLNIGDYLKYASVQMAAEAFLRDPVSLVLGQEVDDVAKRLVAGNLHASKFTKVQAEEFVNTWQIVDQKANTSSGFSGTLFRNRTTGETVLSFRSTEFIDDAARDNQATNSMEIAQFGFAFGQIRDMEVWYKQLIEENKISADKQISVTGYSLGGHLATVFNMLHGAEQTSSGQPRVQEVVTFNGAGVGGYDDKASYGSLTGLPAIMAKFKALSENDSGDAFIFADAGLNALYKRARVEYENGGSISDDDLAYVQFLASVPTEQQYVDPETRAAANNILLAVDRINTIRSEVTRLLGVTSGNGQSPAVVPDAKIAQESLDYQMAVLDVQQSTSAASLAGGLVRAFGGKRYGGFFQNQFDVVGDTSPSAVANSQWHYGTDVRVFIEDQPLYRGTVVQDAALTSFKYLNVKLLVDGYEEDDFGDTHGLVLLVDSLSVQNALAQLLPADKRTGANETFKSILTKASYLVKRDGVSDQGKAEGDVLENVVNALADLALGPGKFGQLNGSPEGNSWWNPNDAGVYTGRDRFYELLKKITDSDLYKAAQAGSLRLNLEASDFTASDDLAVKARNDFGAFAALYSLSPFVLTQGGDALTTAVGSLWGDTYADWNADRSAAAQGDFSNASRVTDQWLKDRAEFLVRKDWFNTHNINPVSPSAGDVENRYVTDATYFKDVASGYQIAQGFSPDSVPRGIQRYYFGDANDNSYVGGASSDHLYGGGGNDAFAGDGNADWLEGNAGDDNLDGGEGNDTLLGGAGSDTLNGGVGDDELSGGAGGDVFIVAANAGFDTIVSGDANDRLELAGHIIIGSGKLQCWQAPAWRSPSSRRCSVGWGCS